jgi:hypothetical protein
MKLQIPGCHLQGSSKLQTPISATPPAGLERAHIDPATIFLFPSEGERAGLSSVVLLTKEGERAPFRGDIKRHSSGTWSLVFGDRSFLKNL